MRHPPQIVEKARGLRKQNLSFYEIGRMLNLHNSTVRNWCYDLGIRRYESLRLNNEIRRKRIKLQDAYLVPNLFEISSEQSRLFAALLYGCEGSKYPSTTIVAFVNSDPSLISTFLLLLRRGFELDEGKLRVQLQIHNNHNNSKLVKFWSKLLKIPANNFLKPTITKPRGKMRRQNYSGTCSLRYIDNKVQLRLLGIFENFCSQGEVA